MSYEKVIELEGKLEKFSTKALEGIINSLQNEINDRAKEPVYYFWLLNLAASIMAFPPGDEGDKEATKALLDNPQYLRGRVLKGTEKLTINEVLNLNPRVILSEGLKAWIDEATKTVSNCDAT